MLEGKVCVVTGAGHGLVVTIPGLGEAVEADRPVPVVLRRRGMDAPEDDAPLVVYLPSDAAAGLTGECIIAAGGDRITLWSHPGEVVTAVRDGGWTVESVAAHFPTVFIPHLQAFRPPERPDAAASAGAPA